MTELKVIPKPEGFDLRDKRSDKSNKGVDWLPTDALYDAFQVVSVPPAGINIPAVVVVWREVTEDGSYRVQYRYAGDTESNAPALLVAGLGSFMGWDRKG